MLMFSCGSLVALTTLASVASANPVATGIAAACLTFGGGTAPMRVQVTLENLSPVQGTNLTSVWVAFHDGTFDLYDDGFAASAALESMAEDGIATQLSTDLATAGTGQADGVIGTTPLTPGSVVLGSFVLDPTLATSRFCSFIGMVLPSNDAFFAPEDPTAVPIFDVTGDFIATSHFILGADVRDAGSEVNDELAANIPTLEQIAPNTGTAEGGLVGPHAGLMAPGSGGILDLPEYAEADFIATGYPVAKLRFSAAVAITEDRTHSVTLKSNEEVPPVTSKAKGSGTIDLSDNGTLLTFSFKFKNLKKVTAAHLHLGALGAEGAVVVDLLEGEVPSGKNFKKLKGTIDATDLTGPLAGMPLDALVAEMAAGNVYVNIHTTKNPDGEIRGQVVLDTVP